MAPRSQDRKIQKYWNEIAPKKHRFFKVMAGNFKHEMLIPEHFCAHFKGKLGTWCTLKGPSEGIWRVRVTRPPQDSNKQIFSVGWADFITDNYVEKADILLFTSSGDSSYDVTIFKANGCVRVEAFFATNKPDMDGVELGDSHEFTSENIGSSVPFYDANGDGDGDDNYDDDDDDDSGSEYHGDPEAVHKKSKRRLEKNKAIQESSENDSSYIQESSENDYSSIQESSENDSSSPPATKRRRGQPVKIHKSNRRSVSSKAKARAVYKACKFELKNTFKWPIISITMLPSQVDYPFTLRLPKIWAMEHMIHKNHDVKLRVPNVGKWIVSCRWASDGHCRLIPRWRTFVEDNNLKQHDVLMFELVKKADLRIKFFSVFKVHIFRVLDE